MAHHTTGDTMVDALKGREASTSIGERHNTCDEINRCIEIITMYNRL